MTTGRRADSSSEDELRSDPCEQVTAQNVRRAPKALAESVYGDAAGPQAVSLADEPDNEQVTGQQADCPREDELLSRLYEQVTEQQAARFAAGYDMAAGLDRFQAWLGELTATGQASPQATPAAVGAALRAALAGSRAAAQVTRPADVTETLAAGALVPEVRSVPAVWDADRVVTEIYHGEYKSLVRLAVLLVHDAPTAEEVVQDAFEAMHHAWRRLRDSDKALSYLRQAVVNRSRSVLRHRTVIDRNAPKPAPDEPSAEQGALALIERSAVVAALRTLPDRQREAIVLRYYADLSEADIAATMGISEGAVRSHTARAMATLTALLESQT